MISNINFRSTSLSSDNTAQAANKVAGVTAVTGMDDKVLMSNTARLVFQMLEDNQAPEDLDRIMQLQQAIQSGTYKVDAEKIADKLLKDVDEL